jgi:hypothetical protein
MKPIAAAFACLTSFTIAVPALAQSQRSEWPCRDALDSNRLLQGKYSTQNSPLLIRNIKIAQSRIVFTDAMAKVLNRSKRVVNRACVALRYERRQNGKSEVISVHDRITDRTGHAWQRCRMPPLNCYNHCS